ncbi:hypothetical protein [Bernardetia sp. MNP-M8]|uniref:phosphoribosyltransferase-like protein n=1 Tax=Bernardetia sp. MNP-M8 TaxID=3127470 RepID=UPI0030CEEA61
MLFFVIFIVFIICIFWKYYEYFFCVSIEEINENSIIVIDDKVKSSKNKQAVRQKPNMKFNDLQKVTKLFEMKKWRKESLEEGGNGSFDAFCNCLAILSEEEKDFLIELTERFELIDLPKITEAFISSYKILPSNITNNDGYLYVYPLTKNFKQTHDKSTGFKSFKLIGGHTKSAESLYYQISTQSSCLTQTYENIIFSKDYSLNKIFKKFNFEKDILLLIDDFTGTGETASGICKNFLAADYPNGNKLKPSNIIILTLAAQQQAIDNIGKLGIEVYANIVRKKAITDYYPISEISEKIKLMKNIEKKVKCNPSYTLGYTQSEALISFYRPPNNTFPVYWQPNKTAIFPRFPKKSV